MAASSNKRSARRSRRHHHPAQCRRSHGAPGGVDTRNDPVPPRTPDVGGDRHVRRPGGQRVLPPGPRRPPACRRAGVTGRRSSRAGDAAIHSICNSRKDFAVALHVYGGDFFSVERSESAIPRPTRSAHAISNALSACSTRPMLAGSRARDVEVGSGRDRERRTPSAKSRCERTGRSPCSIQRPEHLPSAGGLRCRPRTSSHNCEPGLRRHRWQTVPASRPRR